MTPTIPMVTDPFLDGSLLASGFALGLPPATLPSATLPSATPPSATPSSVPPACGAEREAAAPAQVRVATGTEAGAEAGAEAADLIKRTYKIRPDQDDALGLALAHQTLGEESAHGADRSEIVRALLDLHGYNGAYVRGEGRLR